VIIIKIEEIENQIIKIKMYLSIGLLNDKEAEEYMSDLIDDIKRTNDKYKVVI